MGISAAELGMLENSINAFQKSLAIEDSAETFNNLGNVLRKQNYIDKAASKISNSFEEEFINSDIGNKYNLDSKIFNKYKNL